MAVIELFREIARAFSFLFGEVIRLIQVVLKGMVFMLLAFIAASLISFLVGPEHSSDAAQGWILVICLLLAWGGFHWWYKRTYNT